jgi:hypothetical protein
LIAEKEYLDEGNLQYIKKNEVKQEAKLAFMCRTSQYSKKKPEKFVGNRERIVI